MKRINSLLSVDKVGCNMYKGTLRNGNKKADVVIPKTVPYSKLTFSEFFTYCIEQYEIYLCSDRSKEYFINLFDGNTKVSKEDLESFFNQAKYISLALEEVYGENLKFFLYQFATKSGKVCNKEFATYEDKIKYLITKIEY